VRHDPYCAQVPAAHIDGDNDTFHDPDAGERQTGELSLWFDEQLGGTCLQGYCAGTLIPRGGLTPQGCTEPRNGKPAKDLLVSLMLDEADTGAARRAQ
jgi:hypothetical protein